MITDIILSLTRTLRPGYLRDLRRLTVALSRSRLGLYILGRHEVFESCYEIQDAFKLLFERPHKLELVVNEMFPAQQRFVDQNVESTEMAGVEHLGQYVVEMTQAKIKALKDGGSKMLPPVGEEVMGSDGEGDGVEANIEEQVDAEEMI